MIFLLSEKKGWQRKQTLKIQNTVLGNPEQFYLLNYEPSLSTHSTQHAGQLRSP